VRPLPLICSFLAALIITRAGRRALYGEFRSISALIDRAPLLRQLDSLGRVNDAFDA
jgi:hypothetical protein